MEKDVIHQKSQYTVYIVRCSDATLYTGITTDIKKRIKTHNSGAGSKYTRSRLPVKLVYTEVLEDRSNATSREYAIKQLTREQKLALIKKS